MIQHTRSLTLDLSPPILYELGLEPAVEWLAEGIQRQHWITIEVESSGGNFPLDDEIKALLFSAVRELLMNVVKHAFAKNVKISIIREREVVRVSVADDGRGLGESSHRAGGGFGLFNIRERLRYLGGAMDVNSEPGAGTRVSIVAPLHCDRIVQMGQLR